MDCIALEIFIEIWLSHNGLLASKLGKKASTNLGAIHWQRLTADLADADIKPFSPDGVNYGSIFLKGEVDQHLS
jgi:hypothetical protein